MQGIPVEVVTILRDCILFYGMKYLFVLVSQIGMAHIRFDFFFNEQRQEVHVSWNFLFIFGFQKKAKAQRTSLKEHIL